MLVFSGAVIRTDYGYVSGQDRIIRTDYGYAVSRQDGTQATITKTDYGYAVTESAQGNTHPRRAKKR